MEINLLKYHQSGRDNLNGKKHFHDFEFEILHILSGEGIIMIKDKLYAITPHTIFFIYGKDAHYSSPKNAELYVRNKIIFPQELLLKTSKEFGFENTIDQLFMHGGCAVKLSGESSLKTDEFFLKLFESVKDCAITETLKFFINLFSIMDTAIKKYEQSIPCIKNQISDVIIYINKNMHKKISLDEISRKTNISKYYLCHSFSSMVGMTVFEYVQFVRISKAKQLLAETDYSVLDIALRVGFDNSAYFSKVFRQNEKMTPSQYRKTICMGK